MSTQDKRNSLDRSKKKKRKIDDATVTELQARINKAKAAVGPIHVNPATIDHLAAVNRDIEQLNMTQLEHEAIRLEARLRAVKGRIVHLMATPGKRCRKRCSAEGCTNAAQKAGVCRTHGAPRSSRRCSHEGCTNQIQSEGVCYRHGAKYKLCSIEGCRNKIQQGGLCCKHGAKVKKCSHEGCENNAAKRGHCQRHQHHEENISGEEESVEEYVHKKVPA